MATLVDTNVLLRFVQQSSPLHIATRQAIEKLAVQDEPLFVCIQNIAEFWNVATRGEAQNGLGFTIEKTSRELKKFEEIFQIISEDLSTYIVWKNLLSAHRISGVQVHDARLVAVMIGNGISRILTFNIRDFARYTGIAVIHPAGIV